MRALRYVVIAMCCIAASHAPFQYVVIDGNALKSSNGVPVTVRAPARFRILPPTSRHATFDSHPYEVSLAALVSADSAVMLHAEKVSDSSGASNYDELPPSSFPAFHVRAQCASIAADDVRGEHDLNWLAKRGWSPVGNVAVEQHLKTSPDHNREVVVSFITRVKDCSDKQSVASALSKLRSQVRVTSE
jgi:hypothetical protein